MPLEKIINDQGSKSVQRSDKGHVDRSENYLKWHREQGRELYMQDIDCIEYKFINGEVVPLSVNEITMVESGIAVTTNYLNAIVDRFNRDAQYKVITSIAKILGVEARVVLYREDCTEFWLYNLTKKKGWLERTPEQMKDWLYQFRSTKS
ncbi:MAG: hypothetical protein CVU69_05130 [Deltaproteobacteria bacterium HGW-Deltaproteobacteria-4]|nr:MAG: hypothetical protein CVU69_05130 [Deltaproteobacteria bacterium HGW-Deltaproteobacteria-4]